MTVGFNLPRQKLVAANLLGYTILHRLIELIGINY
jgi:hypothetical protein